MWETAVAAATFILISAALTFGLVMRYTRRTKEFERRLVDANETLKVFMSSTPVPLMSLGPDGTVKSWNVAAERALGWSQEEVVGRGPGGFCPHGDEVPAAGQDGGGGGPGVLRRDSAQGQGRKSQGLQHLNGSNPQPRGQITGVVAALVDLSDIRQTEEALRESQRVLSTLMSNVPGMAYRRRNDEGWTMEFVSEGCLSLTGYAASTFMGVSQRGYTEIILPEDLGRVKREVGAAVSASRPYTVEYGIKAADGSVKYVWEQGRGVERQKGRVATLEGLILDVTERRKADRALGPKRSAIVSSSKAPTRSSSNWTCRGGSSRPMSSPSVSSVSTRTKSSA